MSASEHAEISAKTRSAIHSSVIEREIDAGILSVKGGQSAICFMRRIESQPGIEHKSQFFEAGERERQQIASLKQRVSEHMPDGVISYSASWDGTQLGPACLDRFCDIIQLHLRARIDHALEGWDGSEEDRRDLLGWDFARSRLASFAGRSSDLHNVATYISTGPRAPCVVSGAPGSGKTTLLLRAAVQAQIEHADALHLHYFIGGNTPIRDVGTLLRNLAGQLLASYSHPGSLTIPDDPFTLEMKFADFLALATPDRPLVVFIDGLDLLTDSNPTRWLPLWLPEQTRLIVSTASGKEADRVSARIPDASVHELDNLPLSEAVQLFQKWLHGTGRTLTSSQWSAVLRNIAVNSLPLYLRLLFEEVRLWRSYRSEIPDMPLDVAGLLDRLFTRLESPSRHGQLMVSRALGLIAAGKYGLAEDELMDVLSSDPDILRQQVEVYPLAPHVDHLPAALWARLYSDLDALLIDRQNAHTIVLGFYHSQVDQAIRERYLASGRSARHGDLARYFGAQQPFISGASNDPELLINRRMVAELAYQLSEAGWSDVLKRTLLDATFVQARLASEHTASAVDDMGLMADDPEVGPLGYALQLSAVTLNKVPGELWNQIHGRTKDLEEFLHNWPSRSRPCFTLLSRSLAQSQGHLLAALIGHEGPSHGCALTQDGRYAVSGSSDATLRLWDMALGRTVRLFRGHSAPAVACAIGTGDQSMVSASEDRTLRLWDLASGETLRVFAGHSDAVTCCALTPDGRRALSGSEDRTLRLWDLASGETLRVFAGHSDAVTCCALTPDGRRALSGSKDETLRLWDLETGDTTKVITGRSSIMAPNKAVNACAISQDGRRAIVGAGTLQVLDLATGETIRDFAKTSADVVSACALSSDGRFAVASFTDVLDREATLVVADLHTGQFTHTLQPYRRLLINDISVTGEGELAISTSQDGTVRLWKLHETAQPQPFQVHRDKVNACSISAEGDRAVSVGAEGQILVWDLTNPGEFDVIRQWGPAVIDCAIHPDGRRFVTLSAPRFPDEPRIHVWDIDSGSSTGGFGWQRTLLTACAIVPDSNQLLTACGDRRILVWDMDAGKVVKTLRGHKGFVFHCVALRDGARALSSSADGTLRLWDLASGKVLRVLRGHSGEVRHCAVTPDELYALSGSWDNTLRLWDLASGETIQIFHGHEGHVRNCTLTSNGDYGLSVADDCTMRLWNLSQGVEVARWTTDAALRCCAAYPGLPHVIAGDDQGGLHVLRIEY